jgi:transcription elongation factor Elf1
VPSDAGRFQDRLARAVAREREQARVEMPERGTALDHVFECVCCGKVRGEEERREPNSEVCVRCVEDAGFWS